LRAVLASLIGRADALVRAFRRARRAAVAAVIGRTVVSARGKNDGARAESPHSTTLTSIAGAGRAVAGGRLPRDQALVGDRALEHELRAEPQCRRLAVDAGMGAVVDRRWDIGVRWQRCRMRVECEDPVDERRR